MFPARVQSAVHIIPARLWIAEQIANNDSFFQKWKTLEFETTIHLSLGTSLFVANNYTHNYTL